MMLHPFEKFRLTFIDKLLGLQKRYLVAQTYRRAPDPEDRDMKTDLLLTDYENAGAAHIHFNAVKQDPFAAIIDLQNLRHREKLVQMLSAGSKYTLYWSVVRSSKQLQQLINARYRDNMRKYIDKHTTWRISRDTTLYPAVEVTFGELFIVLRHAGQTLRIKFEEIESQ